VPPGLRHTLSFLGSLQASGCARLAAALATTVNLPPADAGCEDWLGNIPERLVQPASSATMANVPIVIRDDNGNGGPSQRSGWSSCCDPITRKRGTVWGEPYRRPPSSACRLRGIVSGVPISDALRASVNRRLARLRRVDRIVIMRGSVIGRSFDLRTLTATAACSRETAVAALERARNLQLVTPRGGGCYSFRHALTQEIVYSEFVRQRVRTLHRRVVRVLAERLRDGEPVLQELAYHAWVAADVTRALRYNERAGDDAFAVSAREDARRFYCRARSVVEVGSPHYTRLTEKLRGAGGA
jgi:hypothetical protein